VPRGRKENVRGNRSSPLTNILPYKQGQVATAVSFYFTQAADRVKAHSRTSRNGHACEIEASVALYLTPQLMRTGSLAAGELIPTERRYAFGNQPFALQVPVAFDKQTHNGALGDARLADAEIGRDIIETAIARTLEFIEGFISD
jgi:creatinine amidohydrolase